MARNNQAKQIVEVQAPAEVVIKAVESTVVEPQTFDLEALMTQYKTKSNVIRFLTTQGKTRSEIAKFMNIRYQHVRNVLTQPLKAPAPVVASTEPPAETE